MAEVGSKEFFVGKVGIHVSGNNLSFSPLASFSSIFALVFVSISAELNGLDIIDHDSWGTEWMIWDQLSSIAEDAECWAFGSLFTNTFR
jgi:hypothetical protein